MKALDLLNLIEDGEGPGLNALGVTPTGPLHKLKKVLYKLKESNGNVDDNLIKTFAETEGLDFDQVKMGYEVEKEHKDAYEAILAMCGYNKEEGNESEYESIINVAPLFIAKDHIVEIPDYYTRLKKMEEEAKKGE